MLLWRDWPLWLLLVCSAGAQDDTAGISIVNATTGSTPLTNLSTSITPANRPPRSSLSITTNAQNPSKTFPAGALLWTYLEIINKIYEGDSPLFIRPETPWVRGCIFGFQCTYFHVDAWNQPPDAYIAWGMVGIINEQFKLNTANYSSATWKVESWRYSVNGRYVTSITNNFPTLLSSDGMLSSEAMTAVNGTAPSCNRNRGAVTARRVSVPLPPTYMTHFGWTDVNIPLRSTLALFFDLFIRFFFRYEKTTPLVSTFNPGYTFYTGRDPYSGAYMTLTIVDATLPAGLRSSPIPIGDLYESIHCWLFTKWAGDAASEERLLKGFNASFSLWQTPGIYATLALSTATPNTRLQDLNQNIWTGGSWLVPSSSLSAQGDDSTITQIQAS